VAELPSEFLARRFQLAALTTDPTRPGILAQRVDHGPPDSPFGEGLELDAARFVEAVRRVNQADDAILHEISDID